MEIAPRVNYRKIKPKIYWVQGSKTLKKSKKPSFAGQL